MLLFRIGSVVELDFGRVLGKTIGFLDGILLGTYVGIELGFSEFPTDGTKDEKVDGLLLGS